jgi:phage baseplate assembly protein W
VSRAVDFPLRLDRAGGAARVRSPADEAERLIEELLFTSLGERLNRPDLGCGLLELVFEPLTDELRAATQFQVTSQLQRWLGDEIRVLAVTIVPGESSLTATISFALAGEDAPRTVEFVR